MSNIINYLIFIVSTATTYGLGILSKKHKWNETLPIPLQNCFVGIVVFVLAYVFCLIMQKDVSTELIFEQIVSTMFGVETATFGYDIKKSYKEK